MQVFSIPYLLSQDNDVNKKVLSSSPTIYDTLGGKLEQKNLNEKRFTYAASVNKLTITR